MSLDISVMLDSPDENWVSMDLVGEMLLDRWHLAPSRVQASAVSLRIPRIVRRFAGARPEKPALNADRALARYIAYPLRALVARRPGRFFHVVDHSYAQLVHVLPALRTGVYCHDLDAFRTLLAPEPDRRWSPLRPLAWTLLQGVQSAAVVFHSTREVGGALERLGLVPRCRLVYAPYGIAPEFQANEVANSADEDPIPTLRGRRFLLHVGSSVRRKRLDVLFETFARIRAKHPDLQLVQQGARLSPEQEEHIDRLGIRHALVQPPKLTRSALAGLYRRAAAVLVTSDSEGFGFPVVEAMACGAIVVASDIPVLQEVGGTAAVYAPVGNADAWSEVIDSILQRRTDVPPLEHRLAHAGKYTWDEHARTILESYEHLALQAASSVRGADRAIR